MDRLYPITDLLVLRTQAGERDAFATLAALWRPIFLAHAARRCAELRAPDDWPGDVVQDAWLDIAKSIRRLDDPRAFGAWAQRIVSRRIADRVRKAKRERWAQRGSLDQGERDRHAAPDSAPTHDDDDLPLLRLALETLPHRDHALLAMAYRHDMTLAAIAEATGLSTPAVKSRLHRTRRKLRHAIERMQ